MAKPRSKDSLLTKLENMNISDELFVDKANGYVSDCIHTVKSRFPNRQYKQLSVYTHIKIFYMIHLIYFARIHLYNARYIDLNQQINYIDADVVL